MRRNIILFLLYIEIGLTIVLFIRKENLSVQNSNTDSLQTLCNSRLCEGLTEDEDILSVACDPPDRSPGDSCIKGAFSLNGG